MARPRRYDLDDLLDHARALWVEHGQAGLTIRALSGRSGASNGAIYNAFGTRDNLLARVWLREAEEFLRYQRQQARTALRADGPRAAVEAAALAPAAYAQAHEDAARLLLAVRPGDLMDGDLGAVERAELGRLRDQVRRLVRELAQALWGRSDRTTRTLMAWCVTDLPGRLLLAGRAGGGPTDPVARHALVHAVRGITGADPPG